MPFPLTLGNDVAVVTSYTLTGPSTATVGIVSDYFVVTLGPGTLGSPVDITPDDGGAGGTFTVVSVTLTDSIRSALFAYTPAVAGTIMICVTNDGGLDDPPCLTLNASAAPEPEDITHGPIIMLKPAKYRWRGGFG